MRFPISPLALLTVLVSAAVLHADDEDAWRPGLVATFSSGEHQVSRIEPDVCFEAGAQSPLEGIAADGFSIAWRGHVLVRETPITLHIWMQGDVAIRIGETLVFQQQRDTPGWVSSEPLSLQYGFQELDVTFRKTAPEAALKVFWSSESFPLEPLPTQQLFHEASLEAEVGDALRWDSGRQLFAAHRCDRCHAVNEQAQSEPAPALWGVMQGINPEWLTQKLLTEHAEAATSRMPNFGFDRSEAEAIAAYLVRLGSPTELMSVPEIKQDKKNPLPSGSELLHSLGCVGCHRIGELGTSSPQSGPDLSRIGAKRSPEWLATWLLRPERINPQHSMPVFKLSSSERGLLVEALANLGRPKDAKYLKEGEEHFPRDQIDHGRDLVKQFRCANCHKIPAIEADRRGYSTLRDAAANADAGCLGTSVNKERGQPTFLTADRKALQVYVNSLRATVPVELSAFANGRQLLERQNCVGCHARDGAAGITPWAARISQQVKGLEGHPGPLIPPNLTAIGDKLLDAVLTKAIAGEQDRLRQDWLKIRMPRFNHSRDERSDLLAYLIGHDRIPADAPDPLINAGMQQLAEVEQLENAAIVGRQLVGAGGFSCIACHQVGDYRPRNVAEGTRGSDLKQSGSRLRPEFYFRWARAPLRIVPGMEMPSYQRPVPGILDANVERQLAVVWKALQDPTFEAPTNPSQVEQFLVVVPDAPPRFVRDVFELPEVQGGGYVARSFAVGFNNGHSILFDLDTATVRQRGYGDFARQRAEGKSWFWDLAGTNLLPGLKEAMGWRIREQGTTDWRTLSPVRAEETVLLEPSKWSYRVEDGPNGNQVVLTFHGQLTWQEQTVPLEFREVWSTLPGQASSSGWTRQVTVTGLPAHLELAQVIGNSDGARFEAATSVAESASLVEVSAGQSGVAGQRSSTGTVNFHLTYSCELPNFHAVAPPLPDLPTPSGTIDVLPGYTGERLPLSPRIMPTALTWSPEGKLLFTSLKGHVYGVNDSDGDGLGDELQLLEEGLAAPFGLLVDGDDLLVTHKAEMLRLTGAGHGEPLPATSSRRSTEIHGWGYNENYHDWVTGPVRDHAGNLYLGLGSDYSQPKRPVTQQHWRGAVLKVSPDGHAEVFGHELRYPVGIALDAQDRLFVTDQQGVQNTFNELNHIRDGRYYGVPSQEDLRQEQNSTKVPELHTPPAVQIPHPWTRSVNGLFFLPVDGAYADNPFAGHGIGCEYNGRFLVRLTLQEVGGELQGAAYPFTRIPSERDLDAFVGPICGGVAPNGDIYVGSIHDSGWLGGLNTGELVRLHRNDGPIPNGLREVRLTPTGFELEFIHPLAKDLTLTADSVSLTGYTRRWSGSYGTEDSDRHSPTISERRLSDDRRTLHLNLEQLRTGFVYEFQLSGLAAKDKEFFPATATYTVNRLLEQ